MTDDEWDELIDQQLAGKLPESTPEYIRRLCKEKAADKQALDNIQKILSGTEWSADTLDAIAAEVRESGRDINDFPFCEDCDGTDDHEPDCEHA